MEYIDAEKLAGNEHFISSPLGETVKIGDRSSWVSSMFGSSVQKVVCESSKSSLHLHEIIGRCPLVKRPSNMEKCGIFRTIFLYVKEKFFLTSART